MKSLNKPLTLLLGLAISLVVLPATTQASDKVYISTSGISVGFQTDNRRYKKNRSKQYSNKRSYNNKSYYNNNNYQSKKRYYNNKRKNYSNYNSGYRSSNRRRSSNYCEYSNGNSGYNSRQRDCYQHKDHYHCN